MFLVDFGPLRQAVHCLRFRKGEFLFMETATNAENIMPSLNVRDLVKKKKRDEISCLEDSFQFLEVEKSELTELF